MSTTPSDHDQDADPPTPTGEVVHRVPGAPPIDPARMKQAYLPRTQITHRVDVRAYVDHKVAALAAHESQQSGGPGFRTVTMLRRLPGPVRRFVLGREWFRDVDGDPSGPLSDDVFDALR